MGLNQLNTQLRNDAISHGLCEQWQNDWSKEEMVQKMFKGIDFCLKHRLPSNDFIKENFDLDFRRANNVLVDDRWSFLNPPQALILGESRTTIRINRRYQSNLYIRDNSKVKLIASNYVFVIVELMDYARIDVEAKDNAFVCVISHSKDARCLTDSPNCHFEKEYDWLK